MTELFIAGNMYKINLMLSFPKDSVSMSFPQQLDTVNLRWPHPFSTSYRISAYDMTHTIFSH